MATKTAVAQDVRAFFTANPNLIPEGCENGVKMGKQGRLPRAAVEVFNKAHKKKGFVYAEGNKETIVLPVPAKDSRGRNYTKKVPVPMPQARTLAGSLAGKRGYLSAAALTHAGEVYAKTIQAQN